MLDAVVNSKQIALVRIMCTNTQRILRADCLRSLTHYLDPSAHVLVVRDHNARC